MEENAERRKILRYNYGNLSVDVKTKGFLDKFKKSHHVEWIDFNLSGLSILSWHKHKIGDKLTFNITIHDMENDVEKDSVSGVEGIIRRIKEEEPGLFRYGVEFEIGDEEDIKSVEIKKSLINIELMLNEIVLKEEETVAEDD